MSLRATPGSVAHAKVPVFTPTGPMVTVATGGTSAINQNGAQVYRLSATAAILVTITNSNGGQFAMASGSVEYVELEKDQEFTVAADT